MRRRPDSLSRTTVKSGDVQANICCNVFRITRSIISSGARNLAKADDMTCANHRSMSNHVCNLLRRLMPLRMTILQNPHHSGRRSRPITIRSISGICQSGSYRREHSGTAFFHRLSGPWHKVRVVPTVTRDNFADAHGNRSLENRTMVNKGVKFAVFTTGIYVGR